MPVLEVSIAPAPGIAVSPDLGIFFLDAIYSRTLNAGAAGGLADLPSVVQDTARAVLDKQLHGSLHLPDVTPSSSIDLHFLGANGGVRLRKTVGPAGADALAVELSKDDVAAITATDPQPVPRNSRHAFFVPVTDQRVPFERSKLQIAPIRLGNNGWGQLGLDQLFHSDLAITTSVQWNGSLPPGLVTQSWAPFPLAADGQFAFSFPVDSGDAWLWWLSGPLPALGIVIDDLAVARVVRIGVGLPGFSGPVPSVDGQRPPFDVTEAQVATHPNIYTEDPGEFCKPFSNPERVLGERSFFVILRAEQPVISAEATVNQVPLPVITSVPPRSLMLGSEAGAFGPAGGGDGTRPVPGRLSDGTSEVDFVRHTIPAAYTDVLSRVDRSRTEMDATHPMQWEDDSSRYQAVTVARGHILEFRMRWRSNGYSLGTVAKTLTLAPRQVRRIEKVEWRRSETSRRQETTRLFDQVSDTLSRDRTYEDAVQANLSEWERGQSEASMSAGAAGVGFAGPGFVIGGGGASSNASSSSSQEAGRRTSASEEQRLRDTIRRYGDALRKLDSLVVNEVTQEESTTGTIETVRNPNYGHSLSVIYYQILRHLKMETAIAGVRECLFVPFAISPFTLARTFRWRELIQAGIRDQQYSPAIRYLKDVLTHFANSDVPPGRRSDQPVRYIHGSLFLRLGIERPVDKDDGAFDQVAWMVVRPYLGTPALAIYQRLKAIAEAQRDAVFQQQHAPVIAASWVDTLQMDASGVPLNADFTLATRYQFNSTVRVDFSIQAPAGVTRETLGVIHVRAGKDLPPGSVANLENMTLSYATDKFERTIGASQGSGDLVTVETGVRDAGATIGAIPDIWERADVRAEMISAVNDLMEHLNRHVEYYTKLILWGMDRDRLWMMIDGFYVPGTDQVSIASIVERDPVAIIGNALVFRVSPGSFLGLGDIKTPTDLFNHYVSLESPSEPMLVSLPTDGLYAQTIMDECAALEEHFGNVDWVLNDPDPALGEIAPELLASRRAEPTATTPSPLPQTLINLQNVPEAPAVSGLSGALSAVTNANAFRDMTGLAGTQANAAAALQAAANLATSFGTQAAALKLAEIAKDAQNTQTADQKVATVQRALDKKLITGDVAQQHTSQILDQLHGSSDTSPGNQREAAVTQAVFAASASDKPFSVLHTTADGSTLVSLASDGLDDSGGGGGGGGGSGGSGGGEPASPPFPVSFQDPVSWHDDVSLTNAFRNAIIAVSDDTHKAVYDVNGALPDASTTPIVIASLDGPGKLSFAGQHFNQMYYSGSLLKVGAMFAAFQLRKAVTDFTGTLPPGFTQDEVFKRFRKAFDAKILASAPAVPSGMRVVPKYADILKVTPVGAHYKVEFLSTPDPSRQNFDGHLHRMIEESHNPSAGVCIQSLGYSWINGVLRGAGMFKEDTSQPRNSLDRFAGIWLAGDYLYGQPYIAAQHQHFLHHDPFDADAEEEFELGISGLAEVRIPSVNDGPSKQATSCLDMTNLFAQVANGTLITDDVTANTTIGDMLKTAVNMSIIGRFAPSTHFDVLQSKIGVGTLGTSGSCNPDTSGHTSGCVLSEALVIQEKKPPKRKFVVVYLDIRDPGNHNNKDLERLRDIIDITIDKF